MRKTYVQYKYPFIFLKNHLINRHLVNDKWGKCTLTSSLQATSICSHDNWFYRTLIPQGFSALNKCQGKCHPCKHIPENRLTAMLFILAIVLVKGNPNGFMSNSLHIDYFWSKMLKTFLMEDKNPFKQHSQYHGKWWPGDTRCQVIKNHGIEVVIPNILDSTPGWLTKYNRMEIMICLTADTIWYETCLRKHF